MSKDTVTIVGAGVIGGSYAAWYAAKGYQVRIYDARDNYESAVREHLRTCISEIPSSNVDEAMERVSCFTTLEEAVQGADLVQESGPETVDFKQTMFADLEKLCGSETLLASSSSGITPEVIGAKNVYIGAVWADSSGYPDCRPAFYEAMNGAVRTGTKDESGIVVKAPFVNLKKKDLVLMGKSLGVPFERTWSCYRDGEKACGRCDSCALRRKAFAEAGVPDPLPYEVRPAF